VPVAALVIVLARSSCERAGRPAAPRRTFDLAGAITITPAILALVLGVIRAEPLGWSSSEVIGLLIAFPILVVAFVISEARSTQPLSL